MSMFPLVNSRSFAFFARYLSTIFYKNGRIEGVFPSLMILFRLVTIIYSLFSFLKTGPISEAGARVKEFKIIYGSAHLEL